MTRPVPAEAAAYLSALQESHGFEFPGGVVGLETPRSDGDRPLHIFAGRGDVGAVKALLAAGAQVNARGDLGLTPLGCAVTVARSARVAEVLLDAGADPAARDEFGRSPLDAAQADGDKRLIALLKARRFR